MKIADWAKDEIKELIDAAYMDDPARQRKDVVRIVTDQIRAWREDLAEYLREIGPQHVIESEVGAYNRATRKRMADHVEDTISGQERLPGVLPPLAEVEKIRLTFYMAEQGYIDIPMIASSIAYLKASDDDYAKRMHHMSRRRQYIQAVIRIAEKLRMDDSATVLDVYKAAGLLDG